MPVPEGIFTVTVALVFPLEGNAAKTSLSLAVDALQVAVVQVCAWAARLLDKNSKNNSEKERGYFIMWCNSFISTNVLLRFHFRGIVDPPE